jgi:hypothetical protein
MDTFSFIEKSSPNESSSWKGMILDAVTLRFKYNDIYIMMLEYLKITGDFKLRNYLESLSLVTNLSSSKLKFQDSRFDKVKDFLAIGQLAFKSEAAGKLRIFAMVDT